VGAEAISLDWLQGLLFIAPVKSNSSSLKFNQGDSPLTKIANGAQLAVYEALQRIGICKNQIFKPD